MNPLNILPLPYRIGIVAFLLLAAGAGMLGYGHSREAKGLAQGRAEGVAALNAYKTQVQAQAIAAHDAAIKAQQAAQAETDRRLADQQEASRVHEKQLDQARADAAAADVAVKRLQHRIAQLAAASGGGSAPSGNPAPASDSTPAARVGDVASESVAEYAALAEAARRGQLAGNECSARYDALMHAPH